VTDTVVHRAVDLDAHRFAPGPLLHDLLDRGEEVGGLVHLDLEIRVPCDPEREGADNFETGKEPVQVGGYEVFEVNEMDALVVPADRTIGFGDPDEPGEEVGRNLEPGKELFPARVPHDNGEVEREVRDERERVRAVEGKGRENREDLVGEEPVHGSLLSGREIPVQPDDDPVFSQFGQNVLMPAVVKGGKVREEPLVDGVQLLGRCHAIGRSLEHPFFQLPLEPRDPDHEELI
jgi:hypothetical protein